MAAVPLAIETSALATLSAVTVATWALIVFETRRYGDARHQVRHGDYADAGDS